jgi:hypothetical protein
LKNPGRRIFGKQQHVSCGGKSLKIEYLRSNRNQHEVRATGRFGRDVVTLSGSIDNREVRAVVAGQVKSLPQAAGLSRNHNGIIGDSAVFPLRGARLGIEVDQRDGLLGPRRRDGQADRGSGLASAALLTDKRNG